VNKILRFYLTAAAVAFFGAFVVQTFLPQIGGTGTRWGLAPGWQREIGFWNVAMLVIILGVLTKTDASSARIVVRGLLVLGILLGTNHLFAIITDPQGWAHYTPMIVNYVGVIVGWLALLRPDQDA